MDSNLEWMCRKIFACVYSILSVIQNLSSSLVSPTPSPLLLLTFFPSTFNCFEQVMPIRNMCLFVWICLSELLRVKTGNQSGKKNTAQGTRDSLMKNLLIILIRKDLSFNVKSNCGESTMNNCSSMYYYCISRLQQIVENTEDATHGSPFL